MRVRAATLYGLEIPFVESFSHGASERHASDAIVLRVETAEGVAGHGEGLARPYVTGETVGSVRARVRDVLWPAVRGAELDLGEPTGWLDALAQLLPSSEPAPEERAKGVVAHNAARCALELALLDAAGRTAGRSVSEVLPPRAAELHYGAAVGMAGVEASTDLASRIAALGLGDVKVKVGDPDGVARVAAVREALGPEVALRVDANGAWDLGSATAELAELAASSIELCEEPLGRARREELAALARTSGVPILLDESLVTLEDARFLAGIEGEFAFDLRVSKCGGLGPCLELAEIARAAGIAIVIGCQVGETSILSAAGRHLAAHLADHRRLEGSFGHLLLTDDVVAESVAFGHGGRAPLLDGPGLGVAVERERLERLAVWREELA